MDAASEAILALRPVTFRYKPEIDQGSHPADRPGGRRSGQGEPGSGGARREGRDLHRALRSGERDVASTSSSKSTAGSKNEAAKGLVQKSTVSELKITVSKQEALIAQQQAGDRSRRCYGCKEQDSSNPDSERSSCDEQGRAANWCSVR